MGCIIVSFVISWQLTLIMLCIIPLIIISSTTFSKACICIIDYFLVYHEIFNRLSLKKQRMK